jgi:hypothetical protein
MKKFHLNSEDLSIFDLREKAMECGKELSRLFSKDSNVLLAYILVKGRTIYYSIVPKKNKERLNAISCVHSYARHLATSKSAKHVVLHDPIKDVA